jgi:glutaconate CoA-transferase subunit A
LLQGFRDTDLYRANPEATRELLCPFSGTKLTAVPAIKPDVTILHAQQADLNGNVLLRGITGAAREAALAAQTLLVTVEEQVEKFDADMNAIVLPGFLVNAIALVPGGAFPSYAQGYYPRDNRFYQAWDSIARERETFLAWMHQHVLDCADQVALLHKLGVCA